MVPLSLIDGIQFLDNLSGDLKIELRIVVYIELVYERYYRQIVS